MSGIWRLSRELERRQTAAAERRSVPENRKLSEECDTILEEGQRYIRRIHQANDAILDDMMSGKAVKAGTDHDENLFAGGERPRYRAGDA